MTREEQERIVIQIRLATVEVRDQAKDDVIMTLCFHGVPRVDEELTTNGATVYRVRRVRRHASAGARSEIDATVWVDRVSAQDPRKEGSS